MMTATTKSERSQGTVDIVLQGRVAMVLTIVVVVQGRVAMVLTVVVVVQAA